MTVPAATARNRLSACPAVPTLLSQGGTSRPEQQEWHQEAIPVLNEHVQHQAQGPERQNGNMTRKNTCHSLQPSIRAACSISAGKSVKKDA